MRQRGRPKSKGLRQIDCDEIGDANREQVAVAKHTHTRARARTHTHIHTCTHTHAHARTHTCTHTHAHINTSEHRPRFESRILLHKSLASNLGSHPHVHKTHSSVRTASAVGTDVTSRCISVIHASASGATATEALASPAALTKTGSVSELTISAASPGRCTSTDAHARGHSHARTRRCSAAEASGGCGGRASGRTACTC